MDNPLKADENLLKLVARNPENSILNAFDFP